MTSFFHLVTSGLSLVGIVEFLKSAATFILAFAVVFGVLAFCHEFGHFLTAKMLGMSVDQFGIGFPPTYGWTIMRRSGTSYTIHPVPLGAFVKIRGMDPGDQDAPNSFLRQPPWARLIVLAAGSAANLVLAIAVFIIMGVTTGLPVRDYVTPVVKEVTKDSPAWVAGLRSGDTVIGVREAGPNNHWVGPQPIPRAEPDATAMVELIHHGWSRQTISGRIEKVGKLLDVRIQLPGGRQEIVHARPAVRSDPELKDYAVLGYRPGTAFQYERVGPITAVDKGIDEARDKATYLVRVLLSMAVQLVEHKMTPAQFGGSFVGPVGIARTSGEFVQAGLPEFLGFLGMLSINLAVLNLLPLPIFDGGNIIIVLLEVLRRKQLEPAQFMAVQLVGLAFIMCLFVYLTYHDIVHLATGTTAP